NPLLSLPTRRSSDLDTSAAEATKEDAMRGVTYYVDSFNGDDRNDGRHSGRAWKTLRAVNEVTFHPGDRILFRRGGIWFGQLHPRSEEHTSELQSREN